MIYSLSSTAVKGESEIENVYKFIKNERRKGMSSQKKEKKGSIQWMCKTENLPAKLRIILFLRKEGENILHVMEMSLYL